MDLSFIITIACSLTVSNMYIVPLDYSCPILALASLPLILMSLLPTSLLAKFMSFVSFCNPLCFCWNLVGLPAGTQLKAMPLPLQICKSVYFV